MNGNEETPTRVREVRERHDPTVPALVHAAWEADFPWLVQGTTTRGAPAREFDLGLFSEGSPAEHVRDHWDRLLGTTGMRAAMHARQVHGADVRTHGSTPTAGLHVVGECDGHVTSEAGVLLAVTIADCVPVFVVEARTRRVAVIHAGWRGAAAGVVERGLAVVVGGSGPDAIHVHLGPAICGRCYEVGPEVFDALGEPVPPTKSMLDLRVVLARRVVQAGVDASRLTVSEHCTRCTASGLFSHRGGDRGRQVGYLGIRT
jgi:YfiH family protein